MRIFLAALAFLPLTAFAEEAKSDPRAMEIVADFAKFYHDLSSFQVTITTKLETNAKGREGQAESIYDLSLQRPASLALTLRSGALGASVVSGAPGRFVYVPALNSYITDSAPKSVTDVIDSSLTGVLNQGFAFGFEPLLTPDIKAAFASGHQLAYSGDEEIGGVAAHRITVSEGAFTYNLWIAQGDKPLLLKSETILDLNKIPSDQMEKLQLTSARRTSLYTDWKVNEPIPATTFEFKAPEGAKLVESFVPKNFKPPTRFVAKPGLAAPNFTLKDLDGKEVKLSDLRDRIVVLVFWTSKSAPSLEALAPAADAVKEMNSPIVSFYTINPRQNLEEIRELLKTRSLDVPVLLDPGAKVTTNYGFNTVPQTLVINKEGIIHALFTGMHADMKNYLLTEMKAIAAGEKFPAVPPPPSTSPE